MPNEIHRFVPIKDFCIEEFVIRHGTVEELQKKIAKNRLVIDLKNYITTS